MLSIDKNNEEKELACAIIAGSMTICINTSVIVPKQTKKNIECS